MGSISVSIRRGSSGTAPLSLVKQDGLLDSPEARQRLSHAHGDLDDANRVVGYDALTLGGVRKQALPIHYGRGLPGYDIGMGLLARFAIADGHQRQGLGRDLLIEAIERAPHRRHSRPAHPPVPDHRDQGRELAAAPRSEEHTSELQSRQ